ncbi:RCE1 family protein [Megaselia abdita]
MAIAFDGKYFMQNDPAISILACLLLVTLYVGGLYVWSSNKGRNDPQTIKYRSFSVCFVSLISPTFVYVLSPTQLLDKVSIFKLIGVHFDGILLSATIPLAVTFVLFLGPIMVKICSGKYSVGIDIDIFSLRTLVIAPFCEEFTFRACMMPIMLQSFSIPQSCIISSLLFGIGHFHHIYSRLKDGLELKSAIIVSLFQFSYTTIFGIYSAYLFTRTGHFIAPLLAHSFCNFMGVPDIQELYKYEGFRRTALVICYFIGLFGWIYLIKTAFQPNVYNNYLYT